MMPFSSKEKASAAALRALVEASVPLEEYRSDKHIERALEAIEAAVTSLAFVHYRDIRSDVRQALFKG